jgi:cobalamin biosynthesis protein CobT
MRIAGETIMRSNPFESQLERLARTLTDQFGVQVVCQGDEAWTDGKQIMLPSLPEPLDEPLERMVVGYLDHEMAHVAFSDFGVVKEFSEKHPGNEAMLNVVEDALIEQQAMRRWPGVRANLDAMFAQIRDRVMALAAQGQSTAVSIVLDASGSMTINKMDVARDALRVLLSRNAE